MVITCKGNYCWQVGMAKLLGQGECCYALRCLFSAVIPEVRFRNLRQVCDNLITKHTAPSYYVKNVQTNVRFTVYECKAQRAYKCCGGPILRR